MSQLQPPYAHVYGSSQKPEAHSIPELVNNLRKLEAYVIKTAGRVKITRKSSTGPRAPVTGRYARSEHAGLSDLHIMNKDFTGIFAEINNQLSQCELSKADEEVRKLLYDDLEAIGGLIVTVLTAHRQVAHTIREVLETTADRGVVPDVRPRLTPAWQAIRLVNAQLSLVVERRRNRSERLKEGFKSEDAAFKALCELLHRMKPPLEVWGVETGLGFASPIWSGIRTDPEELQKLSTNIIQCLANIGALARFRGFVDQIGPDAPLYKHDAFKATGDSLVSVKDLTKQLGQTLGGLEHSWLQAHSEDYPVTAKTPSAEELLGIAQMLDKHVDDCMVMADTIQRNISLQTKLLSPVELYEERKWKIHGTQALRSCPKRAATLASYVEQRVAQVHRVIRSRCMSVSQ